MSYILVKKYFYSTSLFSAFDRGVVFTSSPYPLCKKEAKILFLEILKRWYLSTISCTSQPKLSIRKYLVINWLLNISTVKYNKLYLQLLYSILKLLLFRAVLLLLFLKCLHLFLHVIRLGEIYDLLLEQRDLLIELILLDRLLLIGNLIF